MPAVQTQTSNTCQNNTMLCNTLNSYSVVNNDRNITHCSQLPISAGMLVLGLKANFVGLGINRKAKIVENSGCYVK